MPVKWHHYTQLSQWQWSSCAPTAVSCITGRQVHWMFNVCMYILFYLFLIYFLFVKPFRCRRLNIPSSTMRVLLIFLLIMVFKSQLPNFLNEVLSRFACENSRCYAGETDVKPRKRREDKTYEKSQPPPPPPLLNLWPSQILAVSWQRPG